MPAYNKTRGGFVPGEVDKVILLPRYTTLVGKTDFITAPINVRPYAEANISFWRGNELGTVTSLTVTVQESPDLTEWKSLQTFSTAADTEETKSASFTMDWIRLKVEIDGSEPSITCWCVAEFVRREVARAGVRG
jgi:hypothetical protein